VTPGKSIPRAVVAGTKVSSSRRCSPRPLRSTEDVRKLTSDIRREEDTLLAVLVGLGSGVPLRLGLARVDLPNLHAEVETLE
jgi:hypothetical protein